MERKMSLTRYEVCLILASVHNEALRYKEYAEDNKDDKVIYRDFLGTSRELEDLEKKLDRLLDYRRWVVSEW